MTARQLLGMLILLGLLAAPQALLLLAAPQGADIIANSTEIPSVPSAAELTTVGGSFTTMVLNLTQQTPRWKAVVGNVTGSFSLDDPNNATIYDWEAVMIAGEVYASRADEVEWTTVRCANESELATEQTFHNMTVNHSDNINRTFNETVHRSFFVGNLEITASQCRAIATYVDDQPQATAEDARFQQIMLSDTDAIVWATILEQDRPGYDLSNYDFQMLLPESEVKPTPTTYYFWAELS